MSHLIERNMSSDGLVPTRGPLQSGKNVFVHEAFGFSLVFLVLLGAAVALFSVWAAEYATPIAELVHAECMVLGAEEETWTIDGFQREPLYRVKIQVYLFMSMQPECCCNVTGGAARCSQWAGVAFDTISAKYTPKNKRKFLERWGHPGNFYPCWHSRDKEVIVFERDANLTFLIAPCVAVVLCIYTLWKGFSKVYIWGRALIVQRRGYGKLAGGDAVHGEGYNVVDNAGRIKQPSMTL